MFPKQILIVGFLICLPCSVSTHAKVWRGIVPMHSTRADVEGLLGKPTVGTYYDFENERAQILYVEKPCESTGPLPGFNVPVGTVSQIIVHYKNERHKSDLRIDESKFIKTKESDTDWQYYSNGDEGVTYTIYEPAGERNGLVGSAVYYASASDEYLRCPAKPKRASRRRRAAQQRHAPDAPPRCLSCTLNVGAGDAER